MYVIGMCLHTYILVECYPLWASRGGKTTFARCTGTHVQWHDVRTYINKLDAESRELYTWDATSDPRIFKLCSSR